MKLRIDHNAFREGGRTINPSSGRVEGVIDHNTFLNSDIAIGLEADDNTAWTRPQEMGTANSLFIEDNTFTVNNSATSEPDEQIYHQEGARTVIRYNTFDFSTYTAGNSLPVDSHGNQCYYTDGCNFMGQPTVEIYNNTFSLHHTYRVLHIRGGSLMIHDNTMTTVSGRADAIQFTEEEAWKTAFFSPLRTVWPAEDQIMNTFVWNNTLNGYLITNVKLGSEHDATFIQQDRDYFMHAPAASGGKETYPGRQGAADMTFSSSGANAYYPYTPYIYPHPLVKGTSAIDASPP
jgi:hypothetical protein